ncbi:hypothetical protein MTP09_08550 [Chryseobacterium suipulveris]|uniref:Nucleotide modification associated domain-containing protein n=1 Tax=Chryseobacterium suipulveris TaxID=2929800 RepID=A0ABY4BQH9_9FLAO|nr:hypothetical protein [Chryseobacterium suipulveris]UOE39973.1 hypothetical protein MTP09_08550 [Chryseobacterium suipulveris]
MEKTIYVVKYSGPFGFIKPWTAVRDSETFSQQFLTPSIVEGIEKKLFPELLNEVGIKKIVGHRLNYCSIDIQQERTWAKGGFSFSKEKGVYKTNLGILKRGVMIEPNLYLAFNHISDAEKANTQSICLCRNEDILHPEWMQDMPMEEFENIGGFELIWGKSVKNGFKVGHNRFDSASEMFGELKIVGNPIRTYDKIS